MHLTSFLSALFITSSLAAPRPIADPQYGPASAAISTVHLTSVIVVTSTLSAVPSFTLLPVLSPHSTRIIPGSPTQTSVLQPTSTGKDQAGVYICNDVNWSGTCTHNLTDVGTGPADCVQMDGKASSIGVDVGFTCWFYTNAYCRPFASDGSDFLQLTYPGIGNLLTTPKGDMNDRFYGYLCLRTADAVGFV